MAPQIKFCHHLSRLNLSNLPVTDVKVVLPVYLCILLLLIGARANQFLKLSALFMLAILSFRSIPTG
jgi:hypothetical protein